MDTITPARIADPGDRIGALIAAQPPGRTLCQDFYTDQAIFERDMARIFRRHWQVAGHVGQIPKPGDYFTTQFGIDPVIVARGQDGQVHAMINVCRHRGAHVCTEKSGSARSFSCPYHGWAYGLDGKLLGARHMPAEFDKGAHGLHRVHVRVIQGLILVSLAETPLGLETLEATLNGGYGPYGWADAKVAARETYQIQANWKLTVENYVECYHCAPAHPEYSKLHAIEQPVAKIEQLFQSMAARAGALGIEIDTASHWTSSDHGQESVYRLRYPLYDGTKTGSDDGSPVAPLMGQFTDYDGGATSIHLGGANFCLAYPDHGVIYRFMPRTLQTSEMEVIWLVRGGAEEGKDYDLARLTWLWTVTSDADKRIIELNQAGVNSTFYRPGPFAPMEQNERRWVEWYLTELSRP